MKIRSIIVDDNLFNIAVFSDLILERNDRISLVGAAKYEFVTAHSHYAIEAIRFNALDYLVKPIDPKRVICEFTGNGSRCGES